MEIEKPRSNLTVNTAEEPTTLSILCVESLRDHLGRLQGPESLENEELVHNLRVATKQFRAAWHLVKDLAGSKIARRRRKSLRMLSAHLSSRRDVAVLEVLARNLSEILWESREIDVLEKIADTIRDQPTQSEAQPCPDGLFEEVRGCLEDEIAAWEQIDWTAPKRTRKLIRRGLRKTAKKARGKSRGALKDASADAWHEWRKAIKRLRYQREFVAHAAGRELGKFDARVSRLGSALGERNDLANLKAFGERMVSSGDLSRKEMGVLKKTIALAERDLIGNCRRLGRRFLRKT